MNKIPILIIDDNEADRYLLKRHLMDTNLDLHIFEKDDGSTALEFLADFAKNKIEYPDSFPPKVIFLDINMPLINGWEFLDKFSIFRKTVNIESCVVIMFTSSEREEDINKVFSFEFVEGYFVKGQFTDKDLEKKLVNLMAAA